MSSKKQTYLYLNRIKFKLIFRFGKIHSLLILISMRYATYHKES